MKKVALSKIVSAIVVASTITTLLPLGVSAQWRQNTDNTWSYEEGNNEVRGWKKISDIWYYFNSNGKMNTGWICDNGKWYYNDNSGVMKTGWVKDSGKWYYLDNTGAMQTGWIKDNGKWYYSDSTGAMKTGILEINKKIYYLNNSGEMLTGLIKLGDKEFKFNSTGQAIDLTSEYIKKLNLQDKVVQTVDSNDNAESNEITSTDTPIQKIEINNEQSSKNDSIDKKSQTNTNENQESNDVNSNTTTQVGTSDNKNVDPIENTTDTNTTNNNTTTDNVDVNGLPKLPQNYPITLQASAENKILELMNQKRTEAGLQPLTMDNTLLEVARYKSNHMIQYNYFDHMTPEGTKWTNWLQAIGYEYTATGENIAYNSYDPVELFNQWWNSEGHRANMMNPSYNRVGIGVLEGNGKFMGTQEFSN